MSAVQKRLPTLVWILVALALSAAARSVGSERLALEDGSGWACLDPDSLYHVRRVERALAEGGEVAARDPYLNFPQGAAIPWPPYYTLLASRALGPWVPDGEDGAQARRGFLERGVASLPLLFGVLTTLVVALAGALVAGRTGAAAAGITHALAGKAVAYAGLGNGDHHAFVSLCLALTGLLLALAVTRGATDRLRPALGYGCALGVLAGVAVGSWVGALAHVVLTELVFALLILDRARAAGSAPRSPGAQAAPGATRHPRLGALGLAFHATALAVLAPAVLASPWRASAPWMVINLSWFHLAFLALGGAVFVPLLAARRGRALERHYPWLVLAALLVVGGLLTLLDVGPGRGVREAFAWAGRGDAFMARVAESDPLLSIGTARVFEALGYGLPLLPILWVLALRTRATALLPWLTWTPILAVQALQQQRFAEVLTVPLAVLTGWAIGSAANALGDARKLAPWLATGAGAVLAAALQAPTAIRTVERARALGAEPRAPESLGLRPAVRRMCDWIRSNTPPPPTDPASADAYSVLAFWHWGHFVEWAADRPSVATNFGSYVGEDSFLDPSRFFMEDDDAAAEALLEARRARYVLVTTHLLNGMPTLIRGVPAERRGELVEIDEGPDGELVLGAARPGLERTIGARLSRLELEGAKPSYEHVPFLRLVHVSRARDARPGMRPRGPGGQPGRPIRTGSVWEHVPGAVLEARGAPGTRLSARIRIEFPTARFQLAWRASALAGADGVARLRVPYATDLGAGDGRARGPLAWEFGGETGQRVVREADVRAGTVLTLP